MKKLLCILLVLLLLFGNARPVSATTPAINHWNGVQQTGVIPANSDCPMEVEHMLLTFDLQEFANPYTSSEEDLAAYTGTITTQYTFYNPTDATVTTKLLFLLGFNPTYDNLYEIDVHKYNILVDGETVEKTLSSGEFNLSYEYPHIYTNAYWYEYEITVAPSQRIVNTVTAPIYPDVYFNYEPQIYDYYYTPSPEFNWSKFGTLDVVINTPFHLLNYNILGEFGKTGTGYKASSIDNLPTDYLHFELSTSENPEKVEDDGSIWVWLALIAMVLVLPFALIVEAVQAIGDFFINLFQNLF